MVNKVQNIKCKVSFKNVKITITLIKKIFIQCKPIHALSTSKPHQMCEDKVNLSSDERVSLASEHDHNPLHNV